MKVTLDLGQLLADGHIDRAEYDKLLKLSSHGTASMAFSIIIAIGVIAVSIGLIALVPDATTGLVLGVALLGGGLLLQYFRPGAWDILAHIFVLVGALSLAGGIIVLADASIAAFLGIAAGFAIIGVLARSGLLVMLAVLALSSSIGARTGYMHATYFLGIEEPTATIVLFSLIALVTYLASLRLPAAYSRLAILAARTSLFLVNFGFWIASLWGDTINPFGLLAQVPADGVEAAGAPIVIGEKPYVIVWAAALVATGIWAVLANRRWVVTVVAVFAMIHLYTQWFEWFGPHPLSIFIAGVLTLGAAIALWNFNRGLWAGRAAAGA